MKLWGRNYQEAKDALADEMNASATALLTWQAKYNEVAAEAVSQSQLLAAEKARHGDIVADMLTEHARALRQAHDDAAYTLERVKQEHAVTVARLEGERDANAQDAERWRKLRYGWTWHAGGATEVDGVKYLISQARTDVPTANFRVPTLESEGRL